MLRNTENKQKKNRCYWIVSGTQTHARNLQAELRGRAMGRESEREVLPEAVAGNNGKLSDGEAFNGALTALCW